MKNCYCLLLTLLMIPFLSGKAQVTSTPAPLLEDSQDVVIYYHADQGNKALMGQPEDDPIYAHTGVITNLSSGPSDWKYAPAWKDNSEKYKLEYVSENLWKLNIGDIRTYYGITNPDEVVEELAFVFRNAKATKEGKTSEGGDIFLKVYQDGLHVALSTDFSGNVITEPTTLTLTASSTKEAAISISLNGDVLKYEENVTSISTVYEITDFGTYSFSATAAAGDEAATAEEVFTYLAPSSQKDYPGGVPQMGPVKNADGSVTFCLAAPLKNQVVLVGSWDGLDVRNENVMYYQDYEGSRYFWTTVPELDNATQYLYYFLVDGSIKVGDPYARLVLDPNFDKYISSDVYPNLPKYPTDKVTGVHLAVYQGDINDYDWQDDDFVRPNQTDLVIYELLFRDFTGTEGQAKGNGTVNLALEKLPYLVDLGVNAIELLPINEFNGNVSWGYNPNFYFAPDKAYGTPDDYKRFIEECHDNGIAVILDVVFNQTDGYHPWYKMYAPGSNPFYNLDAPHAYSVLNDWNQGNPVVQQQFKDMLKYWMEEYHVDGFRFDLVKGLGDNDSYANSSSSATDAYNASRVARMKELHDAMREVDPTAYFINENLAGNKEENEMAKDGELNWANVNNQGCQYAMGYQSDSSLARFYAPRDSRDWGSTVSYLESHDEERLAYKQNQYGAAGVKGDLQNSMARLGSAAAQMILCPGSHMIWMFSEMGNDQTTKNSSGNDTGAKIVNWNNLNNQYRAGLVKSYQDLIFLRLNNQELFTQEATFKQNCSQSNWALGRTLYSQAGDKELITVINPSITTELEATGILFATADNSAYSVVSKTYATEPTFDAAAGTVTVAPNSYVVIATNNVSGVEAVAPDNDAPQFQLDGNALTLGEGDYAVYSLSGVPVYAGKGGKTLALPAGIYVIKAGGKAVKVAVF